MRRLSIYLLLMVLAGGLPGVGRAQEPAWPDSAATAPVPLRFDGTGTSAWGPIAATPDSIGLRATDPGLSAWEVPVAGLWWLIKLPFALLSEGVEALIDRWEYVPFYDTLSRWLARLPGFGVRVGAEWTPSGGFAYGVRVYEHRPFDGDLHLQYGHSGSARGDLENFGALRLFAERRTWIDLVAGYRRRGAERFYGTGPGSREDDGTYFSGRNVWTGGALRRRLPRDMALEGRVFHSEVSNAGPRVERDDPAVEDVFAGNLPYGWGARSAGMSYEIELIHDDTHSRGRSVRGGLRRFTVSYFDRSSGTGDDFVHYRAALEQFIGGRSPAGRQLALKAIWSWQDDAEGFTHFQRLITNELAESFRGFQDFRFRDRGLASFTAEYRYPVWDYGQVGGGLGMDGYVFWDTGQVFSAHRQIRLEALTHSLGIGIRLVSSDDFLVRAELAGSREDLIARLSLSQVFQRAKGGMYDGRLPLPTR